jgi:hypothetical protein
VRGHLENWTKNLALNPELADGPADKGPAEKPGWKDMIKLSAKGTAEGLKLNT